MHRVTLDYIKITFYMILELKITKKANPYNFVGKLHKVRGFAYIIHFLEPAETKAFRGIPLIEFLASFSYLTITILSRGTSKKYTKQFSISSF